jgi:Flp pilus assembly protein TadD
MSELDVIGALTGTDKSSSVSWGWDYLRHYDELFSRWRYSQINVIEIGVANGSSLAAWERYFDRATLVGIDIAPECLRFAHDRVIVRIGSQEDPGFLHGIAAEFPPTIIIDDGSHIAHHMIAAFEVLFPTLAPGGVYVFEDLAFHFEESPRPFQGAAAHQGLSETHIYDYLNKFMRARAACLDTPEKSWGFARYAFEQIDTITVAGGLIAVRKRAPRDVNRDITVFEQKLANASNRIEAAKRYADYLIKHDSNLERAAALLREVLATQPKDEALWESLVHVLLRQNRLDEASDAANRQLALSPGNAGYWDRLASIERLRDRPELEITVIQRLTELRPDGVTYHIRLSELQHLLGDLPAALTSAQRAAKIAPDDMNARNRLAAFAGAGKCPSLSCRHVPDVGGVFADGAVGGEPAHAGGVKDAGTPPGIRPAP